MALERFPGAAALRAIRRPDRTRVVFGAVDAVGVRGDRRAVRVFDSQGQQKLGTTAAATAFAFDGDRAFTAGDERRGSLGALRKLRHLLADFTGLSRDRVAQDLG